MVRTADNNLLIDDDTSIWKYDRGQPLSKWRVYWHEIPTDYQSQLTNTLIFSLQCIKQELNLDADIAAREAFITCAHAFEELFQDVEKNDASDEEQPQSLEASLLESWGNYLDEHWDELRQKYEGKYIAIWEGSVFDSDFDIGKLAQRVYSELGYRPIFMPFIGKNKIQTYELTSPI